jgi:hypothetical protein
VSGVEHAWWSALLNLRCIASSHAVTGVGAHECGPTSGPDQSTARRGQCSGRESHLRVGGVAQREPELGDADRHGCLADFDLADMQRPVVLLDDVAWTQLSCHHQPTLSDCRLMTKPARTAVGHRRSRTLGQRGAWAF